MEDVILTGSSVRNINLLRMKPVPSLSNGPNFIMYIFRAVRRSVNVLSFPHTVFPRIVRARSINFTVCVMCGLFEGAVYSRARSNSSRAVYKFHRLRYVRSIRGRGLFGACGLIEEIR